MRMRTWVACSDGVTVDISPPTPAPVIMGALGSEDSAYTSDLSALSVVWGHFGNTAEQVCLVNVGKVAFVCVSCRIFHF